MTLQEKREARAKKIAAAKALREVAQGEGRDLTPDEVTKIEALLAEADQLKAAIEADVAQANLDSRISAAVADVGAVVPTTAAPSTAQGLDIPGAGRISMRPNYNRRGMRAFVGSDGVVSAQDEADAYHCGMMLVALLDDPNGRRVAQANQWCRERGMDIMATPVSAEYTEDDLKDPDVWQNAGARVLAAAQSGQTNQYGGAVTPTIFSNTVIDLATMYGTVRREMQAGGGLFPVGASTTQIPRRTGGLTAYFVNDVTAATESRTAWDNVGVTPQELLTLSRVPMSLVDDSIINWADRMAIEVARAFAEKEDTCAIDGDATSTYGGMTGIRSKMVDGDHAGSYVDATAGDDQFTELIIGDLQSVKGTTKRYAGGSQKWWTSPMGWATGLERLAFAQGGSTGREMVDGLRQGMFLGYPVVEAEAMPGATSAYNELVMLFFGDISQACTFADRRQVTVRRSDERYFEYNQIGFLGSERFDFVVHDIGDASNAGPLVGLRGNTS